LCSICCKLFKMVDVEKMTDDEIRTKLIEYGFPTMPITGTTRKIMVKKLKLLMENAKPSNSNANNRRSLATFSSEEESDDNNEAKSATIKEKKNRRITMATVPMQPPKQVISKKNDDVVTKVTKQHVETKRTIVYENEPETNSESETEIIEKEVTRSSKFNTNNAKNRESPSPAKEYLSRYSPPKVNRSPARTSFYTSPTISSAEDRLQQIRSRLSLGSPQAYSSPIESPNVDIDEGETPYLSNFTKRLAEISSSRIKVDEGKRDYGYGVTRDRGYASPKSRGTVKQLSQENKSSKVSFIIFAGVFLFFIALAALYFGIHAGEETDAVGHVPKYAPKQTN